MYSFPEIGPSIPLKRYKAELHEQHAQSMQQKNQQLNKEFLQKECHGVFYVTLCLQTGGEFLTEANIKRMVESLKPGIVETSLGSEIELETIMDISEEDRNKDGASWVLLIGGPGMGKTTISQTLSYRWGIRELWDEKYDFVFHLTCRKLKEDCKIDSKEINILQLLVNHHHTQSMQKKNHTQNITNIEEKLYQHITSYGDRVLVIIDGLDELEGWKEVVKKHNQEDKEEGRGKSTILKKHPVPKLIYNLAFGRLEEKVEVLLTSRPNESITLSHFQKSLYPLGFNEEAIDECSFALCQSKREDHGELMKIVKEERPALYYLCVVPLNCVLLCSRLLKDRDSIKSLTDLSLSIVMACVHSREEGNRGNNYDLKDQQKQLLRSMAQLAFTHFNSNNLIFTNKDLKECNIDVNDKPVNNLMEIHIPDMSLETDNIQASFIHLSIQEFLAAVHVCLTWEEEDVKKVATVDPDSRRLDNVQLYTAGLLGDANNGHKFLQALDERDGDMEHIYQEQANEYVTSMIPPGGDLSSLTKLQMIRCASEGRMPKVVEEVAKAVLKVTDKDPGTGRTMDEVNMLDLSYTDGGLLPHHLVSIQYFIQESGQVEGLW